MNPGPSQYSTTKVERTPRVTSAQNTEKAHSTVQPASVEKIPALLAFQRHRAEGNGAEGWLLECIAKTEQLFDVCTLWTSSIRNRCLCVCVSVLQCCV